ncbi:hypothetical protein PIB30_083855, partial [Stylosanthes scabra]|nr:hypothetical protein [Stylosanthes scabra]
GVPCPTHGPLLLGGASGSKNQREPDVRQVASPSFDFNLQAEAATEGNELGDSRSFGELGVAIVVTPQPLSPQAFQGVPDPDPHVGEALRPDDSVDEPQFIEGDSDDDGGPVLPQPPQGGTSSSSRQHFPPHLSNLNLDALSGLGRRDDGSSSGAHVSKGLNIFAKFQVGQSFHNEEVTVLAVKNYNIRQGGEYCKTPIFRFPVFDGNVKTVCILIIVLSDYDVFMGRDYSYYG